MAQLNDSSSVFDWRRGLFPKEKEGELYQIKANGFYRFFGTHLLMNDPYILDQGSNTVTKRNTLFIGDDTQLPNLLVNISGRPNKKVSWGFDLFAFQFLDGNINPTYNGPQATENLPPVWNPLSGERLGQNMGLNLGLNLYGSYLTDIGTFNVRMGGIHWFSMSDLTLGGFTGYNRFTLYERNPWDPIGKDIGTRYRQMYEYGAVNQDLRWGERAFQGAIVEGINLPNGWSFAGLYGKTELAGGFLSIPNINYGGKVKKDYGKNSSIAINTLNNLTWVDSLNTQEVGFNMVTAEWNTSYAGSDIQAEVGAGRYISPFQDYDWGEAITAKILATEDILPIPIELHYYRISPNVVNNNAIFWNTSVQEVQPTNPGDAGTQSANLLLPFASSMVAIGQMTNNRTGLNLNTEVKVGKVKVSAGYGVSSEINAYQNGITFSHFVNQLTRSRFWRWEFPQNVGPYSRYNKVYRDAFQRVTVTDDEMGRPVNPKKFNQLEIHAKYRTKLNYRTFYAFFLGRYNTAQPELSIIPKFNEEAYIRQYNSELEMYYQVSDPVYLNTYLGYERVLGNYQTMLDEESFRPLNQTGYGIGLGADISLGRNAGLFFRHRWFYFEDESFSADQFGGQETLVELTVYF
jgi:hypothetical protein